MIFIVRTINNIYNTMSSYTDNYGVPFYEVTSVNGLIRFIVKPIDQ